MFAVKLASKTVLSVVAIPARLAQWGARNVAYMADDLASPEARIAAAEAYANNKPLPYQQLKEEYRNARLASIRYRLLYNPMDIASQQVVYNYKWILIVIAAYLAGKAFGSIAYPSGMPLVAWGRRSNYVTIPFDGEEKYKLLENRPGGFHEGH
eukprot:TRINITY_DN58789_c0_g1_i1.p1 TRINITY_DN58789_c0_g1~~TRINITY_DN58789_c0_g1_i1.p1  ORF type:complete len:172 (-),score=31.74 TRINITY_DN58789_c0_g1_i1:1415-1876(-)